MMRREALDQRKEALAAQFRAMAAVISDPVEKAGMLQGIECVSLLLDILIDIAHPDRPQETRR